MSIATRKRRQSSVFGPLVLIAIGVYLLLANLGLVSGLNWWAALRMWPLLLIFAGLNLIVLQAPRPYDRILNVIVSVTAVAIFGYLLLFGTDNPVFGRIGLSGSTELNTEQIAFPAGDVQSAAVTLDVTPPGANVHALKDSPYLIEGTIHYLGDLIFDTEVEGGRAIVRLGTDFRGNLVIGPGNWPSFRHEDRWQVGLNPAVPMELTINVSAGSADLDLDQLMLEGLNLGVSAGGAEATLPGGDYDARIDVSAGATEITLPAAGTQTMHINVSAGSLNLYLPETMEARAEVTRSLGSFNATGNRLERVSREGDNRGVWETPGYEDAANRVRLIVDVSMGSVNVEER